MGAEKACLEAFGDSSLNKLLDFLAFNRGKEYSMADIAKLSTIGSSCLEPLWPKLVADGIVVQTRTVGRNKLFRLNESNSKVLSFLKFYWEVCEH